jgi:hypothetical protein
VNELWHKKRSQTPGTKQRQHLPSSYILYAARAVKNVFLFFKVGLVLVFFMNSPQANKKQRREETACGVGVVAPWRLALREHSACPLPVVLLISRAGCLPLGRLCYAEVQVLRRSAGRCRSTVLANRRHSRAGSTRSPLDAWRFLLCFLLPFITTRLKRFKF